MLVLRLKSTRVNLLKKNYFLSFTSTLRKTLRLADKTQLYHKTDRCIFHSYFILNIIKLIHIQKWFSVTSTVEIWSVHFILKDQAGNADFYLFTSRLVLAVSLPAYD